MKITKETDYAIRALTYLIQSDEEVVDAKVIAAQQGIPTSFTFKVLRKLTQHEMITSVRGAGGGYRLSKLPEEISLYDIICAIEGNAILNGCLAEKKVCTLREKSGTCKAHIELMRVQEVLHAALKEKSLKEILDK